MNTSSSHPAESRPASASHFIEDPICAAASAFYGSLRPNVSVASAICTWNASCKDARAEEQSLVCFACLLGIALRDMTVGAYKRSLFLFDIA